MQTLQAVRDESSVQEVREHPASTHPRHSGGLDPAIFALDLTIHRDA